MEQITHRAFRTGPRIPAQRVPQPPALPATGQLTGTDVSRAIVFDVREARRLADLLKRVIDGTDD